MHPILTNFFFILCHYYYKNVDTAITIIICILKLANCSLLVNEK